jgi:hypothetical protein
MMTVYAPPVAFNALAWNPGRPATSVCLESAEFQLA